MNTKGVAIIIVAVLIVAGAGGYFLLTNDNGNNGNEFDLSKDAVGREVIVPNSIEDGIVPVGVGSLRWVSYFGMEENVVMKDTNDNSNYLGKSYMYAVGGVMNALTTMTGASGGLTNDNVSTILNFEKKPIVIVTHNVYSANNLQIEALLAGGINVCVIYELEDFIDLSTFKVSEKFEYQTKLIGKILKDSERATELIDGINSTISDIRELVKDVTPVKGYVGGLSYAGTKGMEYSSGSYLPFELTNVENVLSGNELVAGYAPAFLTNTITKDTIVFVDANGSNVMRKGGDNVSETLIKAFNANGNTGYIACPYVWFGLNFDNVLIGAYQVISYVYGDQLSKAAFDAKVDAIYDLFYGTHMSTRTYTATGVAPPTTETRIYDDMSNVIQNMNSATSNNGWRAPLYGSAYFLSDGKLTDVIVPT